MGKKEEPDRRRDRKDETGKKMGDWVRREMGQSERRVGKKMETGKDMEGELERKWESGKGNGRVGKEIGEWDRNWEGKEMGEWERK